MIVVYCVNQAYVHKSVMEELKRIIDDSEITKEDDALWPPPDRVGRQVCDLYSLLSQQLVDITPVPYLLLQHFQDCLARVGVSSLAGEMNVN